MIETDATNCMNLPVEAFERDAPMRINRTALRRDSGGPGQYRGGLGFEREYEVLAGEVSFTHRGERHYCPPSGGEGGEAGALAKTVIHRANGAAEEVPSKLVTTLYPGDRVLIQTAGGGGYGPTAERNPSAVRSDVANGKVSPEQAEEAYKGAEL